MSNLFDQYKSEIIKSTPLNQTMQYDHEKWSNWLAQSENILKEELDEIHLEFKGKISRNDLIQYAENANNNKSEKQSIKLFLACMMWGYGGDDFKSSDHRGPYRVKKIFNSSKDVKEIIHKAFCSISKDDIENAFKELSAIKGLSISFLSKFLYFTSRGCKIKNYALIFDVRVAKSIIQLTSIRKDLVNLVSISPSINYVHFKEYIDFAHNLSIEYNCEAENVELFLFEQANK